MSQQLSFELVTLNGLATAADVYEVILPTPEGQIAVLPNHMSLITLIAPGVISLRHHQADDDDHLEDIACAGGVAEISGRRVRLLADVAERADDIDELAAQAALEEARRIRNAAADHVALADATGLIELHAARLKVAELKRRRRRSTPSSPAS